MSVVKMIRHTGEGGCIGDPAYQRADLKDVSTGTARLGNGSCFVDEQGREN